MTVPSDFSEISETATSNPPQETASVGGADSPDKHFRAIYSMIKKLFNRGTTDAYGVGGGTANAQTATFPSPITALTDGMRLRYKATVSNTGSATFAPDAMPAKNIIYRNHGLLGGGEIAAGGFVTLQYDETLDNWIMLEWSKGAFIVESPATTDNSLKAINSYWAKLGMSMQLSTNNGYVFFPTWLGGWGIQWKTASVNVAANTVTAWSSSYAVNFTTTCYWAIATPANNLGSVCTLEGMTTTGVNGFCQCNQTATLSLRYLAIGK